MMAFLVVLTLVVATLPAISNAVVTTPSTSTLGPGPGPWKLSDPSTVGLSAAKLKAAAESVGNFATPFCLAVAKDGALVLDETYGFGKPNRPIESYSAGKTMTAVLMGIANGNGLFDMDVPLHDYGVVPRANWSRHGKDYFPNVTARHLLTQTTGVGSDPPGRNFTYDSSEYIAHLSYLLNATAAKHDGMTAKQWANKHFAEPMGIPYLYSNQQPDPAHEGDTPIYDPTDDVCSGGDQPITCVDFARVGQLLLNNGTWSDVTGTPFTLLDPEYAQAMFTPQIAAGVIGEHHMPTQYSLLSYVLNQNTPINGQACTAETNGLVIVPGMPNGTLLALGAMSRFLFVVPSEGLVVASFGSNNANVECDDGGATWANKASPLLAELWRALAPAVMPHQQKDSVPINQPSASQSSLSPSSSSSSSSHSPPLSSSSSSSPSSSSSSSSSPPSISSSSSLVTHVAPNTYSLHPNLVPILQKNYTKEMKGSAATCEDACTANVDCLGFAIEVAYDVCWLYNYGQQRLITMAEFDWLQKPDTPPIPAPPPPPPGACYCYCPVGQGIGRCSDNTTASACGLSRTLSQDIERYCPDISEVFDCQDENTGCEKPISSMILDNNRTTVCKGNATTTPALTSARSCTYTPIAYGECILVSSQPCVHSAMFPK